MIVVSSTYGVALVFDNLEDLEGIVAQLSSQVEFVKANNVPAPHIYFQSDSHIPSEEVDQWTNWLKYYLTEKQQA